MSASHLARLNEAQLKAVLHPPNLPLQILAGPGSGKTRVLTSRIAHLIEQHKLQASSICAVTFTNKAANEMRERLTKLIGQDQTGQIKLGTFHALCATFLRRHAKLIEIDANFTICDADESKKLIAKLLKTYKSQSFALSDSQVAAIISKAKAKGYSPQQLTLLGSQTSDYATVAEIYEEYESALRQSNSLDFDDLLVFGARLFAHRRVVEWCKHVLVDEFQDTNTMQYELMRYIATSSRCVTVVGDPDQSIYGWRSAEVENLEKMQRDFPSTVQIMLEQNYRSTQNILSTSMAIIAQDKGRIEKTLQTSNPSGLMPVLRNFGTEHEEASFIAREIKRLVAYTGGMLDWDDFVILLRMNSLSRALESALQREGIPSKMLAGHKFFDRIEVKDLLAYLQLVDNPFFAPAFSRIINVPSRTIGEKTISEILKQAERRRISPVALVEGIYDGRIPDIKPAVKGKLGSFVLAIRTLRSQAQEGEFASELIRHLLELIEYEAWLQKTQPDWESRWENVQELINFASEVERTTPAIPSRPDDHSRTDAYEWVDSSEDFDQDVLALDEETPLRLFLQASMLSTDVETQEENEKTPKVTIATCHAAKGLEWPVVLIPAVEKGIIPSARAEDIEEERRLLYVACTRAQGLLYLTHAGSRMVAGRTNNRLISEFISAIKSGPQRLFEGNLPNLNAADRAVLAQVLGRAVPNEQEVSRMVAEYKRTVKPVSSNSRRSRSPSGRWSPPTGGPWKATAFTSATSALQSMPYVGAAMSPAMASTMAADFSLSARRTETLTPSQQLLSSQQDKPHSGPVEEQMLYVQSPVPQTPSPQFPAALPPFPQLALPTRLLPSKPLRSLSTTSTTPNISNVPSRTSARVDPNAHRAPLQPTSMHANEPILTPADLPVEKVREHVQHSSPVVSEHNLTPVKLAGGKRRLGMGRTAVGYPSKKFKQPGS